MANERKCHCSEHMVDREVDSGRFRNDSNGFRCKISTKMKHNKNTPLKHTPFVFHFGTYLNII